MTKEQKAALARIAENVAADIRGMQPTMTKQKAAQIAILRDALSRVLSVSPEPEVEDYKPQLRQAMRNGCALGRNKSRDVLLAMIRELGGDL